MRLRRERLSLLLFAAFLVVLAVALAVMLEIVLRPDETELLPQHGIKPVAVIDGPGTGENPLFGRPMGVAFGPEGRIYVTDAEHNRVCVFDRRGRFLFEFGALGVAKPLPGAASTWRPGLMNYPVGIDVDDDGDVYVADFRNDQIQVFSQEGAFLRVFPDNSLPVGRGSTGQDGHGIAVTDVSVREDEVFATDTYQIFVFSRDGRYKRQFGRPGRQEGGLNHPNGVAAGDGVLYVSDSNHSRVQAFTFGGNVLWSAGTPARSVQSTVPSDFTLPRGLTVLRNGSLLVADAFQFAIVGLAPDGTVTGRFGDQGERPGQLLFPNDVDAVGDLVAVADKDNRRVQLVRLVGEDVP